MAQTSRPGKPGVHRHRVLRVLLPCLAALCVLGIFAASSLSGKVSGGLSRQAAAWLSGENNLPPNSPLEGILRKAGHLAEFALLGLLLLLALRAHGKRGLRAPGISLPAGLAVALCDETIQAFVPGRSSSVTDVWIDLAGFALGVGAGWLAAVVHIKTSPA